MDELFLCPLFKDIPVNERTDFIEKLTYKTSCYAKGKTIACQGSKVDGLYLLLKGRVKTEMISAAGTILHIENISAPQLLAPAFLFAGENRFPVDVITLMECELMIISKSSVLELLTSNKTFLIAYMALISDRIRFITQRLNLLSIRTIKGKLAQYIVDRTQSRFFTIDRNQTVLAEYFGVTRPALARCLAEMIDEGIIVLHKEKGEILNMEKLKMLVK